MPHTGGGEAGEGDRQVAAGSPEGGVDSRPQAIAAHTDQGSGLIPGVLAVLATAILLVSARSFDVQTLGRVLVPLIGLLVAFALKPRLLRRHPDEPWLGNFLVLAVIVKLVGSIARYFTLVDSYDGVGDATEFDEFATLYAQGNAPELSDLRRTNFVRFFTGEVYSHVGSDMLTGFLVFGLIALVGSYLWYRATSDSVPFLNRRLYAGLVFFAPSVVFWPSSIGKEALMNLGLGLCALGTAFVLRQRFVAAIAVALPGGWLLWVVRAHLVALATLAAAAAYLAGRRQMRPRAEQRSSILRPIAMVGIVFLVFFTLSQAAQFLGMEDFSLKSIEAELSEQSERSAQGGSAIESSGEETSLTPLSLPQGLVTVFLRPFPWEVETPFQILASLENVAILAFLVVRRESLKLSLTRARRTPFLLFCWTVVLVYAVTFGVAFSNFGLLARQRSLALPAFFVLIALDPNRAEPIRGSEPPPSAAARAAAFQRTRAGPVPLARP